MADLTSICTGQRMACALRVTRLNDDCTAATGEGNGVVTAGVISLNLDPEKEEGAAFQPKNACGDILWTAEEDDKITRWTGDFEIGLWDFELIELMTDAALAVGASGTPWEGQNAGFFAPGPTTTSKPGVALEIWVKTASLGDEGSCGPAADLPPYARYVFPRVKVSPGGNTFNGEAKMFTGSMKASPNPQWADGPYGDWMIDTDFSDEPDKSWVSFYDDSVPTTDCGYQTVGS